MGSVPKNSCKAHKLTLVSTTLLDFKMWDQYQWITVCGALLSLFVAYGIGANDVANAFGSSVGSKAITIKQALMIAAVFEFAGAVLLGANVTKTVRKGIADYEQFLDAPELYMYGMLCVLLATGIWLILASYYELPVSTTHSTVGGIIGMSVCARGWESVTWYKKSNEFPFMKGVASIVLSWIFSPVLSGVFAMLLFGTVRLTVLRSNNSYQRSWWVFPVLVFLTVVVNSFFIIFKGAKAKIKLELGTAVWISFCIGGVSAIIVAVGVVPFLRKKVDATFEAKAAAEANGEATEAFVKDVEAIEDEATGWKKFSNAMMSGVNHNVHDVLDEEGDVHDIHEFSEKFDPMTEESFKYLQVFTAICDAFSHGANDVANSIGPFAAIWSIYNNTGIQSKSDVPIWILCLGGVGIVIGLATYGYKIMCAIGVKMCRITPSRGFAIELGAAIVIVIGSQLGIPLSTTHCQVGATTGVGMLESVTKGVNWKMLAKVAFGWVMTLVIVGLSAAAFFAQGAFAPSIINIDERNLLQGSIEGNSAAMVVALNQTVYTSKNASLSDTLDTLGETIFNMTNDPAENLYAQHVPAEDSDALLTEATWTTLNTLVPLSGGDISVATSDEDLMNMFSF